MDLPESIEILVVDDDAELRELIADRFRSFKFNVGTASSGHSAYDMILQQTYHMVVTDLRMPEGDGMELLQRIRDKDIELPKVFVITGFEDHGQSDLFAAGADGIFNKPFNTKLFIDTVRKALLSRADRWKNSPQVLPVTTWRASFSSLCDAEEKRDLILGRGGFFLASGADIDGLDNGQAVDFEFAFESGPISQLVGSGEVRWIRRRGPWPGVGLEIIGLVDGHREEALALIEQRIAVGGPAGRAFIPDGL